MAVRRLHDCSFHERASTTVHVPVVLGMGIPFRSAKRQNNTDDRIIGIGPFQSV
jgi:hypothetical protein